MIFVLGFVNAEPVDKKFPTMDALLKYVEEEKFEWGSLVIGVINTDAEEISEAGGEWFKKAQLRK